MMYTDDEVSSDPAGWKSGENQVRSRVRGLRKIGHL